MPTGLESCAMSRGAAHLPIIVLTSCRDVALIEALANGAQDYLIKGEFDDEDLMRAIRCSLARSRAEFQLRATFYALEVSRTANSRSPTASWSSTRRSPQHAF